MHNCSITSVSRAFANTLLAVRAFANAKGQYRSINLVLKIFHVDLFLYTQHSLCSKFCVKSCHYLLVVFIIFLDMFCHTNKINCLTEWFFAFGFSKFGISVCHFWGSCCGLFFKTFSKFWSAISGTFLQNRHKRLLYFCRLALLDFR